MIGGTEGTLMGYLIAGIVVLGATVSGWWACMPGADRVANPAVVRGGLDAWISCGITVGLALGIGSLIFGGIEIFGPLR
jgi:hypothetical protein